MRPTILSLVLLAWLALPGCASAPATPGLPTVLPQQEADLWTFDPATSEDSDNVLIVLQGGPRDFLYFERDGKTLSRYLPDYADYHVVYLHQSQSLNPAVFAAGFDMTIEQARIERDLTTDVLDRAVKHFTERRKRVTVLGHSYGAFVAVHHLTRPASRAQRYLLTAGRLNVPAPMVQDNLRGVSGGFAEDGNTYEPFRSKDFSEYNAFERGAYHVRALLKAAYGEPNYATLLAGRDLSDVTIVSGDVDQQVGTLTPAEQTFLRAHGATVRVVPGGHYDVYLRMIDAVTDGDLDVFSGT